MQITQYSDAIWDAKYSIINAFDSYIRHLFVSPYNDLWDYPHELLSSQYADRKEVENKLNNIDNFLKKEIDKAHEETLKQLFAAEFK